MKQRYTAVRDVLRTKQNMLQYCCTTARSTLRTNVHVLWSLEALRSSSLWTVFQLLLNFLGILPDLSDSPVGDAELFRHSTWFHLFAEVFDNVHLRVEGQV